MTSQTSSRWSDLGPRVLSALVMLGVGGAAIWAGGGVFAALAVVVAGLMTWELARMTRGAGRDASGLLGALGAGSAAVVLWGGAPVSLLALLVPALVGALTSRRDIAIFAPYALLIQGCVLALVLLRDTHGLAALAWLVAVVIVSDVMGYFAGRMLGGPKFWPQISPKKTWSGTVAGWLGALALGLWAHLALGWPVAAVWAAPLIAFAGQLGDIAESAIKRRAGVKDSSNLIPGHGGFLDRFDALIFASVLALVVNLLQPFLPTAG